MKRIINSYSQEILGINPRELKGYSEKEIENFLRKMQDGVTGEKLSEQEILEAAKNIHTEVERIASEDENE